MPLRSGVQVSLNPVLKPCPCAGGCHENPSEELLLEITVRSSTGYASARKDHKPNMYFNLVQKEERGDRVRTYPLQ